MAHLSAGTAASPNRCSALGSASFNCFLFLLLFLQTSAAHQQPRISKKTSLGRREGRRGEGWGAEGKVKDKAWEEVKRGNHIFGHRLRRGERGSRSAEGEGRGQVKVREFDGDPAGWVFIFLLILLRCSLPWRIVVEMDFGAAASKPLWTLLPSLSSSLPPSLPGPRVER